ncbi:MAG: hypothetical protein PHF50_03690 [Patescibacteria group bacterium]|nr:hypothetical protein [Patescibacteria group bacterium]
MSGINFLDNKKGDDQKPKEDKKEKLVWSDPEKEGKSPKGSAFSFLPFINKKEPVDKNSSPVIDKNKIKESREEILNLIKHHENSKPLSREKNKKFLAVLSEKLKKQPNRKEVLIDYQRIFNQEKERKNQTAKIFNVQPAIEKKSAPLPAGKSGNSWLKKLGRLFKNKIAALKAGKGEAPKIIQLPKPEVIKLTEIKPAAEPEVKSPEVKEIKFEESKPIQPDESRGRVIETNLIQGELVTFFDWRSKTAALAGAILIPILIVAAVYYGLSFYQKSSQANNLAQAEKFAELEKNIAKEESGVKEVHDFQAKLKIISKVFSQHIYWTNFFKFLEDNTIKDVYFVDFKGDTGGNYAMNALAASYSSIAEQVNAFKNNRKITVVEAGGGEMVAGDDKEKFLVKFVLNFSVLKNIFIE